MSIYAERLERIRQGTRLSREDVAKVVGSSSRTVARWATGSNVPRGMPRQRLLDLAAVSQQVARVMVPDAATAWLHEPNAELGNSRPMDLIAQGRSTDVLDLIEAIADGVFV